MRMYSKIIGFAALTALLAPAAAGAQDLIVQEPQISSLAAQRMVEACATMAEEAGLAMSIAVVDPSGELLHFHANQGASPTAPMTAILKAKTAARWRRSTATLAQDAAEGRRSPEYIGDFPVGGGLPIVQGEFTLGAIGVAGPSNPPVNPDYCAEHAVEAVFGNTVQTDR
jgi:glc operon protein GlcG